MSDDATVWMKPEQVDSIREVARSDSFRGVFRPRNEAIIALMYDTGLRPGEIRNVTTEMLDLDRGLLFLPSAAQKQYPTDGDPPPTTLELCQDEWTADTKLVLKEYLHDRWKDSQFLFPSKNGESLSDGSVRSVVGKCAEIADVTPQRGFLKADGPEAVHPHTLRHSVAYRMLALREDGTTIYDVKNRLRHQSVKTTEKFYAHFDRV